MTKTEKDAVAKVKFIQKARASRQPRICLRCGHEVAPGESYRRIDKKTGPRSSTTLIFCTEHHPRQSHLLSGRAGELASLTEGLEDSLATGPREALEAFCDDMEGFCDSVEEAAQNIERSLELIEAIPETDFVG